MSDVLVYLYIQLVWLSFVCKLVCSTCMFKFLLITCMFDKHMNLHLKCQLAEMFRVVLLNLVNLVELSCE